MAKRRAPKIRIEEQSPPGSAPPRHAEAGTNGPVRALAVRDLHVVRTKRLGADRLGRAGRQALAARLGRALGNRHVGRAIQSLRGQRDKPQTVVQRQGGGVLDIFEGDESTQSPTGDITITDPTYTDYKVAGKTLADALKVLQGRTHWGYCYPNCKYDYKPDRRGRMARVDIELTAKILLPDWTGLKNATLVEQKEWNRMLGCLKTHEEGHWKIAKNWAPILKKRMLGQHKSRRTRIYRRWKGDTKRAQRQYDKRTQRGKTQGVHLTVTRKTGR